MKCTHRKLHQSIYNILPSHFTYFPTLTYYFFILKLHIVINQTPLQLNGFTSKQSSHSQRKIWSFMLDFILSLSYVKYIFMYFLIDKTQNSITELELEKQLAMTRIHYLHSLLHHPLFAFPLLSLLQVILNTQHPCQHFQGMITTVSFPP